MTHFSVLVVTDEEPTDEVLRRVLLPWDLYEGPHVFVDEHDEVNAAWQRDTITLYQKDGGPLLIRQDDAFLRAAENGNGKVSVNPETLGYVTHVIPVCKHYPDIETFARQHLLCTVENGRFGYRANTQAKFDGWQLGGPWKGRLLTRSGAPTRSGRLPAEQGVDAARRCDLDLERMEPLITRAVVMDGVWYQWPETDNEESDDASWDRHFKELFARVRPDQWIAIVDCRI